MNLNKLIDIINESEIMIFDEYYGYARKIFNIKWGVDDNPKNKLIWVKKYRGKLTLNQNKNNFDIQIFSSENNNSFHIEYNLYINEQLSDLTVQAIVNDECNEMIIEDIHIL